MGHDIRELIYDVVDAVVHDLRRNCMIVERRGRFGRDLVVSIAPKAQESSPMIISHSGDSASVFVAVGEATTIELEARNTGSLREELSDVLSTVVGTGFEERTWWHSGRLVYSEAEFRFSKLQPGEISSQFGRLKLLPQAEMRERRYLPYE